MKCVETDSSFLCNKPRGHFIIIQKVMFITSSMHPQELRLCLKREEIRSFLPFPVSKRKKKMEGNLKE